MGRHRHDLGGAEFFDEDGLRPATVEELAALERAEKPDRRPHRHRRPLVIGLSTTALLIAGAGAFALARSDEPAIMVEPYGAAAPFGVGYKDGFGEHTSKPSRAPSPAKSKSKTPVAPAYSPPGPQAPASLGTLVGTSASSPAARSTSVSPSPAKQDGAVTATLSAVYWKMTIRDRYWIYVWVNNSANVAVNWQVTLAIPNTATVTSAWAVNKTAKGDGVWVLTPPRGTLGPGLTYLFAVEGISSDPFVLHSCTVSGASCERFG